MASVTRTNGTVPAWRADVRAACLTTEGQPKGLVWHHWKVVVGNNREVIATLKSAEEAAFFEQSLTRTGVAIPDTVLGNGALTYKAKGVEGHLPASIWRLSVYGVELGGEAPRFRTSAIYVVVDHNLDEDA